MKIIKISDVKAEVAAGEIFEGTVYKQPLVNERMADELLVNVITFRPGSRTKLHTHTKEQVLYIIDGEGIVATEKEKQIVKPGMIIFIPAGEPHWHGATEKTVFSHINIGTLGRQTNY